MPELEIIRLKFKTPLHISNERSDYASGQAILHSDGLLAAIFFAWNRLGFTEWIPRASDEDPGFIVSSLFPYTTINAHYTYFLPRPYLPVKVTKALADTSLRKQLKKIAWVDWPVFLDIINGRSSAPGKDQILGIYRASVPISQEESFITSSVVPRVSVSRTGREDTRIFYMERFYFKPQAGLYLLASFRNNEARNRFYTALRFLGDEGIGTDRNIGNGKFNPEFGDKWNVDISAGYQYGINLGLFSPESAEQLREMVDDENVGYDFIKRGGWLSEPYNSWRKKNVYMFKEGSCFRLPGSPTLNDFPVGGKMVDAKPTETIPGIMHPVWRNGKTIFIPVKLQR